MKTASIGFMREDGDLSLVATLNNLAVVVLEREDAPDYVELGGGEV